MITHSQTWATGKKKTVAATILIILTITLLTSPVGVAKAGEIKLLTPEPQGIILARQKSVHLVVRLSDPADKGRLRLFSGGGRVEEKTISPTGAWDKNGKTYVHFDVQLKPGNNRFQLNPGEQLLKFNYRPLRSMLTMNPNAPGVIIFHRNGKTLDECNSCHDALQPDIPTHPYMGCNFFSPQCYSCHKELVFGPEWQHGPAAELLCRSCHLTDDTQTVSLFPKGRMDKLCFRCHTRGRKWSQKSHIHGPVGTGDCTVCHNPHADKYPFQLWADGNMELCISCHSDKRKLAMERGADFQYHGILRGRGCVACHDPHASDHRFQLHHEINQLCTECHIHIDKAKRGHPVKNHPVQGKPDPRRPGRTLACTSCHNPHGSMYKHMLIGDVIGGHVCSKCHHGGKPGKPKTQ